MSEFTVIDRDYPNATQPDNITINTSTNFYI